MESPSHIQSSSSSRASVTLISDESSSEKRIRMSRCGQCKGCNATKCEKCYNCIDMIKYGGPGTAKQACERRKCVNPQMPGFSPLSSPRFCPKGSSSQRYILENGVYIKRNTENTENAHNIAYSENKGNEIQPLVWGDQSKVEQDAMSSHRHSPSHICLENNTTKTAPKDKSRRKKLNTSQKESNKSKNLERNNTVNHHQKNMPNKCAVIPTQITILSERSNYAIPSNERNCVTEYIDSDISQNVFDKSKSMLDNQTTANRAHCLKPIDFNGTHYKEINNDESKFNVKQNNLEEQSIVDAEPHTPTELRTKAKILSGIAFTDFNSSSLPSDLLGTWNLSTKRSAVLPTTTAAYLALEAAAAKYAPKAASNAIEAAQQEWWDNIEVVTDKKDVKASKRKRQKFQGDSTLEEKTNDKNNPFDFYKFAEETAGTIKSEPENLENNCNKKFAPPPQWFNKRPKITYSTMCAMAIQNSNTGGASLKSIYEYIIDNFPYYEELENPRGWQIAVRNTLKLNKAFVRQKAAPDSRVGRQGNTWTLDKMYNMPETFKRMEFSILDESFWDLNREIYDTVNSREAIYDSDDSVYKGDGDNESEDSGSDVDYIEQNRVQPYSRLGIKFTNAAALAAETSLEQNPGRQLLSSIGAAGKRHHMGLDKFRQKPLSDFLGLEHCIPESTIRNNPQHAIPIDGRDHDVQASLISDNRIPNIIQSNTSSLMTNVPPLNLLASSALARDAYKATKKVFKSPEISHRIDDNVYLKNVILEEFKSNLNDNSHKTEDMTCVSCNTAGEEKYMLFCATCEDSYHMLCLDDRFWEVPQGWQTLNWNLLTDWNQGSENYSNLKTSVNIDGEWTCHPCTSIVKSFEGDNWNLMKANFEAYPDAKRQRIIRRNKGENMVWSTSDPEPFGATAVSSQVQQESWTFIPNEVVIDVSHIDLVGLPVEDGSTLGVELENSQNKKYIIASSVKDVNKIPNEMSIQNPDEENTLKNLESVRGASDFSNMEIERFESNAASDIASATLSQDSSDADSFVTAAGSSLTEEENVIGGIASPDNHIISEEMEVANSNKNKKTNEPNFQSKEYRGQEPNGSQTKFLAEIENVCESVQDDGACFFKEGLNNKFSLDTSNIKLNRNKPNSSCKNCSVTVHSFKKDNNLHGELGKTYVFTEMNQNKEPEKCQMNHSNEPHTSGEPCHVNGISGRKISFTNRDFDETRCNGAQNLDNEVEGENYTDLVVHKMKDS